MAKFDLTIVVPTYNEGDIIESSLKRISGALGDLRSRTEIIIADDGKDDLPAVIEKSGRSFGFSAIQVMRNGHRLGKGESIGRAFKTSQGNIVGFIDIDLSVAPSFIHDAIREIKDGNDVCIASRMGNRFKTDKSLVTSVTAIIFSLIHRKLLFGKERTFPDTQCGFKFFRKKVALDLFRDLVTMGGLFDLEILLKAVGRGYKISELKVPRINDRVGKKTIIWIIVHETFSLCQIFYRYRIFPYFNKS